MPNFIQHTTHIIKFKVRNTKTRSKYISLIQIHDNNWDVHLCPNSTTTLMSLVLHVLPHILSLLSHVPYHVPHPPLCLPFSNSRAGVCPYHALQPIVERRQPRQPECSREQETSHRHGDGDGGRDNNWAENNEEGYGDAKPDEGAGECKRCQSKQGATDREESEDSYNLGGWWSCLTVVGGWVK